MMRAIRERHLEQARRLGLMSIGVTAIGVQGFDINVVQPRPGGNATLFKAVKAGLKFVPDNSMVYLCEDDCLYPDNYWSRWPDQSVYQFKELWQDCWCYDLNVVNLCWKGFFQHFPMRHTVYLSCSWARIDIMREYVDRKITECLDPNTKQFSYEPGGGRGYKTNDMFGEIACIDIRHLANTTWQYSGQPLFQSEYGWDNAETLIKRYFVKE